MTKSKSIGRSFIDDERIDIYIPKGVVIEVSALPGAEFLTGESSRHWSDALPSRRRRGSRLVTCPDRQSFLNALDLAISE
jgi:hypothetical protein